MTVLAEDARRLRKRVMDQVLQDGTAPTIAELGRDLRLSPGELSDRMRDLEAALCLARQDQEHAGLSEFHGEPLTHAQPAYGEIVYARPFATFQNHYEVSVDGRQGWYAECAAEACSISAQFPGKEVLVRSVCRQTKEPVELVGRDGALLDYSPSTLRVHLGYPVRTIPTRLVGWCDYNNFIASEAAARQWQREHPAVHGITRDPQTMARLVAEIIGKGRLDYRYQPQLPVLTVLRHPRRYGLLRPTRLGVPVLDPFWLPSPTMVKEWRRRGWRNFFQLVWR